MRMRRSTGRASTLSLDRVPKPKRPSGSLKPTKKKPKLAPEPVPEGSVSIDHPAKPRGRPKKKKRAAVAAPQNVPQSSHKNHDGDASADALATRQGGSGQHSANPRGHPNKHLSDVAAPQSGTSKADDAATADHDTSVLMAFANVVVEVPALPTAEVHEAPTEHVVGGVEATPPPADQGSAGEVIHEATAASSSAEMGEGQVSIATTTSESPSSSAGVLQLTSEKRLGRPNKKRSAVAAPQNEAPRAGTTGPSGSAGTLQLTAKKRRGRPKKCGPVAAPQNEALQVGMNVPPSTAERDKSNEPPNLQPPSKKRRGRPKKAPKSAIKPTPMASDSHSHPARLRGRPRKQKPAAAAAPQNVLPTANEQANEDQDASGVMEAVQGLVDAVSLSAQERCDGSADAFPKERHGGDAEANEREADRSSLEARRADETVAPTRDDVTASIRTTDDSTVLGPSHDSEQPCETDPVPSSVPSLPADRLSVVHIVEDEEELAGLCSHMTFAGEEASRAEPESSPSTEAFSECEPASRAAMTSSRLYNLIVPNDPDDLRLASMCLQMAVTEQQSTADDDGKTDRSDNSDDTEPMPAADNAEDDASSVDAFEEAPSSPQEQPDTDGVPTAEADASSGGESPGLNRCSAHRLEIEALRETNERYLAEKTNLEAQLQAKTEELSQLTERLKALQLQKDQELAAMREKCEKLLRQSQESADALEKRKDSQVLHWQQQSHDFEQQCNQLRGELARAQQAARDEAEQNAQLAQRCSQLEAEERRASTAHNPRFCMATSVTVEQLSQSCKQLEDSERRLRDQLLHKSSTLHEVSSRLQKCLEEVERVRSLEMERDQAVKEAERLQVRFAELQTELDKAQAEVTKLLAAVAEANTNYDHKCAEIEALRTESKNQLNKLNTLVKRRRLRLERAKTVIKRMRVELRREKHRRKNRESLLVKVKQEPSVPATDCVHRPSTAEALAELDELARSLEASTQGPPSIESFESQSSSAQNSLDSAPQSGSDSVSTSSISPSISELPSSNGYSSPSPDAHADSHRSAPSEVNDGRLSNEWHRDPSPDVSMLPRAPPVGGRPCFFVMPDVTVPPPTMPPVSTRLGFGVSANGDGQRQQRSMDRAALHQHVAPSVPDVPRGSPPQRPPIRGPSPPQQWAARSRSPLRVGPTEGVRFFPSPIVDYRCGQSRGRFFQQNQISRGQHVVGDVNGGQRQPAPTENSTRRPESAWNADSAPSEPPNVLDGYGYVRVASPQVTPPPQGSTILGQPSGCDRSRSPLPEGPAAKRPYVNTPTTPNGRQFFVEHRGYRPAQTRARSCGPAGRQVEEDVGRGGARDSAPPRRFFSPSQNVNDHCRFEDHRGEGSPTMGHRQSRWSDGQPEGPRPDRSRSPMRSHSGPSPPDHRLSHGSGGQPKGSCPDRSPSPWRARTDRSLSSSREGPVAKRPYVPVSNVDHCDGQNPNEPLHAPRGPPDSEDRAGTNTHGHYEQNRRGFNLRNHLGSRTPADQPAGVDGAVWWGSNPGNFPPQNESPTGSDGRRGSHEGAENRQPDDGNRQHALCPVDPAPLREATHPEGPAPKPRIRTSVFRPMNDEELMARAGGGSSDANYAASNRSAEIRPPKPALRQHDGRQIVPVPARESTHPEGPSLSHQPQWRPANEVPASDIRPSRADNRSSGFRKRSKSFCDDSARHPRDAGPGRRVRFGVDE